MAAKRFNTFPSKLQLTKAFFENCLCWKLHSIMWAYAVKMCIFLCEIRPFLIPYRPFQKRLNDLSYRHGRDFFL